MYTFQEILNRLGKCDEFPTGEVLPEGARYITEEKTNFVPPNLSVSEETPNIDQAQVLIISAAGAVGKSTLAGAIAFNKKALLWDLAIAQEVGASSLDGMLSNTLKQGKEDFLEYLSEGYQFIVIDALDEGRLKVNENSFRRLLENIAQLAKNSKGICFVLLGRKRIAEESWLVLDDEGVRTVILSIESFNKGQADTYINNLVEENKRNNLFYECRDLIFEQLAFSVSEQAARDIDSEFLHYPPVLDVIATLLRDETNLIRFKNSLTDPTARAEDKSIQLVQKVIVSILEREQEKVLPQLKEALGSSAPAAWSGWDSLYTAREQSRRLLESVLGVPAVTDAPLGMPQRLQNDYEERVKTGLEEHPFLDGAGRFANSVFMSYLYARALRGDYGTSFKNVVTAELLKPDQLPIRLVAEFYLEANESSTAHSEEIMPEHIGILYDSLLSSESTRNQLRLNIDGPNPVDGELETGPVVGEFEFLSNTRESTLPIKVIPFTLQLETGGKIDFARFLREASITIPCAIEIGKGTKDFQIGPTVQISARHIEILSESLTVSRKPTWSAEEQGDSVILEALTFRSQLQNAPTTYDEGSLLVSWENDELFPWRNFRMQRPSEYLPSDASELHKTYLRFRRIAQNFRANGRGALAKTRVKIEDDRVMNGQLGWSLLRQLVSDQILILSDGFYFWNSDAADSLLGVSWGNLRKGECPDSLRHYLLKFIDAHPDVFV